MGLNDEERSVIVNLEIEKANNTYSDVLFFIKEERWEAAANRLYYAVFHAVSALLIYDGHNIKSHRGIISMFGQHYVKTNLFTRQDGSLLSNLMIMRDNADYNCFYEADKEKIEPFIEPTGNLIRKIIDYIR